MPLSCPLTITANTTLQADLDCTGVTTGIAVLFGNDGLTLDLGGFKVDGFVGVDTATGIYTEHHHDTIKNGTVENFGLYNVKTYGSFHTTISKVKVIGDPADTSSKGVFIEYGGANAIRRSSVEQVQFGFDLESGAENKVLRNVATTSTYGFFLDNEWRDSLSRNSADTTGVPASYGFYDTDSGRQTYIANTATGAAKDGFYLTCDKYGTLKALRNKANDNPGNGFYLDECYNGYGPIGHSLIKGNTANDNGDDGFYDYESFFAQWRDNSANGNGSYGINIDYPESVLLDGNTTNGNMSDSGIYLEDNYSLYNVRQFTNNTANNNSDYGFYGDYGVPPSITHNNHATGNPTQNCWNVDC